MENMDDRLDARRVRYFMQVVDSGSVRGAAEALAMDPSAVSRAIAVLEQDCGTRLLERRGRGVALTDAGQLLVAYLRRQHSQKQQLLAQLDSIQKVARGHVDVIAGEGFVDWLMSHSLHGFLAQHPGITVDLAVGSTDDIVRRIVDERAHIGLVFHPPKDERLRSHHSYPHPIEALVLDTHPLAALSHPLQLDELLPYAGATLNRNFGVRQHIEAAEVAEGVRLNMQLTTSSFQAMAHFVVSGLGYALISRESVPSLLGTASVISLPMKSPLLSHGQVHVVSRHGRMLPPAAAQLLQQIVADMRASASTDGLAGAVAET
jgi:DNA-binding transcriptional LysR family regulator